MTDKEDGPKGNKIGRLIREAEVYRRMAKTDDRMGRPPMGRYTADRLEERARTPIRLDMETSGPGAGGELILNNLQGEETGLRLRNTVADPDMVTASASIDRTRAVEAAGCLDMALDVADTIEAKNSVERMLAHQMASAHQMAMRFAETANSYLDRAYASALYNGGHDHRTVANTEAARAANAASRMIATFQEAALTLAKIRGGGKQTVVVQHVNVNDGGQAVIAGKVSRKGRGRSRGG